MVVEYILLGVLLLSAIFLVVAVTLQKSSDEGLSGTIAGGAETFFGKDSGSKIDKLLNKFTTIIGIVFVVLVLLVYFIQPDYEYDGGNESPATAYESSYSENINL